MATKHAATHDLPDAPGAATKDECPLCGKQLSLVQDVRYCGRCQLAGVGVDGKNGDPLPAEAMPKLKAARDAELKAASAVPNS